MAIVRDGPLPEAESQVIRTELESGSMATESAHTLRWLADHRLNGFGHWGEGMAVQFAWDGRRVRCLARESRPRSVTVSGNLVIRER